MSNHPEDCQHKQCPWNEIEPAECKVCFTTLKEDEVNQGVCSKHLDLSDVNYE